MKQFLKQFIFISIVALFFGACATLPDDNRDPTKVRDYSIDNQTKNVIHYWIYYLDHDIPSYLGKPARVAGGEISPSEKGVIDLEWGHGRYTIEMRLYIKKSEDKKIDIVIKEKRRDYGTNKKYTKYIGAECFMSCMF